MNARRSRAWIAVTLACALVSGHTAGLQLIAWAGMLVSRVQTSSVEQAVRSTFDGSDPCHLCLAVSALKAAEGQADTDKAPAKPIKKDVTPELMPGLLLSMPVAAIAPPLRRALSDGDIPMSATVALDPPPPRG